MKYAIRGAAVILGLMALFGVLQYVASERVEVVELHTLDQAGEEITTRLWIVDDEGFQYLRVGSEGSGWFNRLRANGEFEITRDGTRQRYTAVVRRDKEDRINALMQEKYTWGDSLIGLMLGSRVDSQPIELHPL